MDVAEFEIRLRESKLFIEPAEAPNEYLSQLESCVTKVLDDMAPLQVGTRPGGRNGARWLDPKAIKAKQHRRRLERRWKKTDDEKVRRAYRIACSKANKLINGSRSHHQCQQIVDAGQDSRRVWSAVRNLLHSGRSSDSSTSDNVVDDAFCSSLAMFFTNKVHNIKTAIMSALAGNAPDPLSADVLHEGQCLNEFKPVTVEEVTRLLRSMSAKSSPLDFVPTSVLKACDGTFAPIIARLANLSFSHGEFPAKFKLAQVTPLLKKRDLDASDPANYRPISNLNTVSKVLERLVLSRIIPHVMASPNFDPVQSAYRKCHSTETALLKIVNDIYEGFDSRHSTILVALDQSAAFDCIDHSTMIRRLQQTFGVNGKALDWFRSYLESRSSFVRWRSIQSAAKPLDTGVPQGSSLGPLLFSLYIAPLSGVIRSFNIQHHQYADDTQIYIAASKSELTAKVDMLECCTVSIHSWLMHNGLQLNPKKSEVIQFTVGHGRGRVEDVKSVTVSGVVLEPSKTVKSLGVTLDSQLNFNQHVANISKECFFHIRALRHVRKSLPDNVAKTVACSIVGARLDYCNSLFVGMSASNFECLQRVQNTLARTVLNLRKHDHITPALINLHWLPVKYRAIHKLATLTYNVKQNRSPSYLFEMLDSYQPVYNLRSSTQDLLNVTRTRSVASRAFRHSSVSTWNSLPFDIRICNTIESFKRNLKTFLFKAAFSI